MSLKTKEPSDNVYKEPDKPFKASIWLSTELAVKTDELTK